MSDIFVSSAFAVALCKCIVFYIHAWTDEEINLNTLVEGTETGPRFSLLNLCDLIMFPVHDIVCLLYYI